MLAIFIDLATAKSQNMFVYILPHKKTNNASERAIRNVKVKQKVSSQFKSLDGAKSYETLRSIIDTSM